MDQASIQRQPRVLVVSDGEWAGRSFESVLEAHGYAVRLVAGGQAALAAARSDPPDAVIVDEHLSDMRAAELTSSLRRELPNGRAIPIIVTSSAPGALRERNEVYAAGAWDYCSQPLDVDTLLLKLKTFVAASLEVSSLHAETLVDARTDFYTLRGLQRWSRELAARAIRRHEPLAAVAFTTAAAASHREREHHGTDRDGWTKIVNFVASQRRASDIIGYIGDRTFAVLAPDTDETGASLLIDRLQRAAAASALIRDTSSGDAPLSVGYWATTDLADVALVDDDLLTRATVALSHSKRSHRASGIVRFDEIPG